MKWGIPDIVSILFCLNRFVAKQNNLIHVNEQVYFF